VNILEASLEGMVKCVDSFPVTPEKVLVDGPHIPTQWRLPKPPKVGKKGKKKSDNGDENEANTVDGKEGAAPMEVEDVKVDGKDDEGSSSSSSSSTAASSIKNDNDGSAELSSSSSASSHEASASSSSSSSSTSSSSPNNSAPTNSLPTGMLMPSLPLVPKEVNRSSDFPPPTLNGIKQGSNPPPAYSETRNIKQGDRKFELKNSIIHIQMFQIVCITPCIRDFCMLNLISI
jgi:hypothetical protein